MSDKIEEHTYFIKGMHCASCEVIIEKKALEIEEIDFADASLVSGALNIRYHGKKPSVESLNDAFRENGYLFSEQPFVKKIKNWRVLIEPLVIALFAIGVFFVLSKLGLSSFATIGSGSSLGAFFIFGLLAGVSTCAALVGGLVLSLSKQWLDLYGDRGSNLENSKPHILFNVGRIISYALLGALLGFLGAKFRISQTFTSFLVLFVSALMLILAMQMLDAQWFNRFRIALPKSLSYQITKKGADGGKWLPLVVGFLTFLLPCGFTLAVEGMAVLSGNALKGLMIMFFFVLGTTIPLLVIGFSSAKLIASPKTSEKFLKVAGILIIFFVLYNINFQFGIIRYLTNKFESNNQQSANTSQWSDGAHQNNQNVINDQSQGIQIIKAIYTESNDIQPNEFEVKVGRSVRFEIDVQDDGYGCMGTIMVPGLWNNPQSLRKGSLIIMEFIPRQAGNYKITCAMGVSRGVIKVIN